MHRHVQLFDYLTLCVLSVNDVLLGQPGEAKCVTLVSIGGKKVIRGGNGIVDGPVGHANSKVIMEAVNSRGCRNLEATNVRLDLLLGQIHAACFNSVL